MALEGRLKPSPEALFFFAIASGRPEHVPAAHADLVAELGELGIPTTLYRFSDFSSYYDAEFGGETWKYFVGLAAPRPADDMVGIKLVTERIQARLARSGSDEGRRTVNIDPGYVNGWQVTLATVKNQGHRIYLGRGVFIEVELLYRHGAFEALPWTYPDYMVEPALGFLNEMRANYLSIIHRTR